MSWTATRDDVYNLFSKYGDVLRLFMPYNLNYQRYNGYALVDMRPDSARLAINGLNETDFMGRKLFVNAFCNNNNKLLEYDYNPENVYKK
jgi:RNA recognition motif-containing protein